MNYFYVKFKLNLIIMISDVLPLIFSNKKITK